LTGAFLEGLYPLFSFIGGSSSDETLLVLAVTTKLNPEFALLILGISFFDLNSSQRNNLSLSILLLGVV